MADKLEAIFFPLISRTIAGYLIIFSAFLIALGMFLLPSQGNFSFPIFIIPDALAMGQKSDFPFALSMTYSFGVYVSLACAFITAFAKGNLKAVIQIRGAHSISFRILGDVFIVVYIWLLLTQEILPAKTHQFSYTFFSNILHNRFAAFMWIEGVFAFTYCMVLICLFDISILLKRTIYK